MENQLPPTSEKLGVTHTSAICFELCGKNKRFKRFFARHPNEAQQLVADAELEARPRLSGAADTYSRSKSVKRLRAKWSKVESVKPKGIIATIFFGILIKLIVDYVTDWLKRRNGWEF